MEWVPIPKLLIFIFVIFLLLLCRFTDVAMAKPFDPIGKKKALRDEFRCWMYARHVKRASVSSGKKLNGAMDINVGA